MKLLMWSLALLSLGCALAAHWYRIKWLATKGKLRDTDSELFIYKLRQRLDDAPPTNQDIERFRSSCTALIHKIARWAEDHELVDNRKAQFLTFFEVQTLTDLVFKAVRRVKAFNKLSGNK